ncbi:MAG: RsmB/NOP family class I SAM-dependent RNA methyltransferase [Chlamydiales bacterium]|nr:RsmB/NOP family class I SAM-dependent RNA methyltransferase [Chlamydiales bacterium]
MKLSFQEYHLFQLLRRFENQHLPLDLFLSQYFRAHKQLGSKDRKAIAEAVYGMCRWQSLLDHLVDGHPSWEKRYACFRGFQPDHYLYVNTIPLHIRVSFPRELFSLLVENYGEEKAARLCQVCNTEAPIAVRVNPLKSTRDELLKRWEEFDVIPCKHSELGIQFRKRAPLVSLPEFKEGLFEIQDEASQCAARIMKVKPGEQALDYCAGAGGKTLAFAPQMENQGQIYLHDIRPYILDQAKKRLKRAGIQNAQFLHPKHPHLETLKKKMDWVFVDAPCTGTGTLRRNPDQKWKFSFALLNRLVGQQRMIFERALSFVKPGGHIVYATCSLLRPENEKQVAHFIETYNLQMEGEPFVSLPSYGEMDGFFAVSFKTNNYP